MGTSSRTITRRCLDDSLGDRGRINVQRVGHIQPSLFIHAERLRPSGVLAIFIARIVPIARVVDRCSRWIERGQMEEHADV